MLHARVAENTTRRVTDRITPHFARGAELTLPAPDDVTARLALYGAPAVEHAWQQLVDALERLAWYFEEEIGNPDVELPVG